MATKHTPTVKITGSKFRVSGRFFEAVGHISNGTAHCDDCDNPEVNARDIEALVERTMPKKKAQSIQDEIDRHDRAVLPPYTTSVWYAETETEHFTFRAIAKTRHEALDAIRSRLISHAKEYGVDAQRLLEYAGSEDNINVIEMRPGTGYRDWGPQ